MFIVVCLALIITPLFAVQANALALAAPELGPHDLIVAADGSDTASGTADSPLSLAAAKEKLKELKGTLAEGERVRVYLRGGRYELNEKLCFTEDDLSNVTYLAYDGEEVVFSGAKAISGFSEEMVDGVRVFTKTLTPGTDPTGFKSLFTATEALRVPRYPESGYFTVNKLDTKNDLFTEENSPWDLTLGQRSFFADPNDLKTDFTNYTDVQVRILHYWKDELMLLTDFNRTTGRIGLSRPASMKIRTIDRYYFENVFEALNEPGEWYLNNKTNKLYYVPKAGEQAATCTLYASDKEQLLDINGVDGLVFEGIRFTETDWNMPDPKNLISDSDWYVKYDIDTSQAAYTVLGVVSAKYADGLVFKNCEFRNLGAAALKLMHGVQNATVDSCLFRNIAATAVFIGATNCKPEDKDCVKNVTVRNCDISAYGRKFYSAIGIHITYCDGAVLENNEISDGYYTGISVGWVWGYDYHLTNNIKIRNNLIYNIGQGWLSDMGGIYMLGIQPGTEITGNVIHNVAADPSEGGYGGWGIYLDEGSSRMLVEYNLVFNCGSNGLNIHYGEGNIFRNNISAFNAEGQVSAGSRGEETHATAFYYDNIFVSKKDQPIYIHMAHTSHFYENGNLMWNVDKGKKLTFALDNGDNLLSFKTAKRKGFIHNATVADPLFTDAEHYDFTLKNDSPAFGLNFKAWDYSQAGTIKGSTIGFSLAGGQTAYNSNVKEPVSPKTHVSVFRILRIIVLVFASVAIAFWVVVLIVKKDGRKTSVIGLILTVVAFLLGIGCYVVYVNWNAALYVVLSILVCACVSALPAFFAYKKKGSVKKAAVWGAIWMAIHYAAFFFLAFLFNNILNIGTPSSICIAFLSLITSVIVHSALFVFRKEKTPDKESAGSPEG